MNNIRPARQAAVQCGTSLAQAPGRRGGPVKEIAELLFERRISAVLEEGRLVGLVSEADLLHRREIGTERGTQSGSWWLRLFGTDRSTEEYIKSHARRARDIMTREVETVAPDAPVAEIATLLEARGIKRVPVLQQGRLVGIVSRSNLVQALAVKGPTEAARPGGDDAIRASLLAELERQPWWRREAARVAAENVSGVRRIEDHRFRLRDLPASI